MKKCVNCGREINDADQFCTYCGMEQPGAQNGCNDGYRADTSVPDEGQEDYDDEADLDEENKVYDKRQKPKKSGGGKLIVILAIVLALIVACILAYVFYSKTRTPELQNLTYDKLITEYDLSPRSGDIRDDYNDNVRFEFEDVKKDSEGGFRAEATIYTPDMEDIYEKTTESSEVEKRLGQLTEDDLEETEKTVDINSDGRLTQDSAKMLKDTADDRYMSIMEYQEQNAAAAANDDNDDKYDDDNDDKYDSDRDDKYDRDDDDDDSGRSSSSNRSSGSSQNRTITNSGYVLPDSSSRYISASELDGLSSYQLRIARNEIYARHGRMFRNKSLQSYFNSCSWYTPTIPASQFNDSMLSAVERANVQTIKSRE